MEAQPEVVAQGRGPFFPVGMPRYVQHTAGIPFDHVIQLMRFRTGAHHLAIESGRWASPSIPRGQRHCAHCPLMAVEDELHFLFECPAYQSIREQSQFSVLFEPFGGSVSSTVAAVVNDGQFWRFMEQDPKKVARLVYECCEHRRFLAAGTSDGDSSQLVSSDADSDLDVF